MTENLIRGGPTRRDAIAETLEVSVERSLRVMIVDDEAVAADALVQLVRFWGHDGQAAYDGASGLELAARHVPEVVFLDLAMPDMNGSELAKELRLDDRLKRCFVIAITGHTGAWRSQSFSQTDIDLFLPKPIDACLMKSLLSVEGKRLGPARNHPHSVESRRSHATDKSREILTN